MTDHRPQTSPAPFLIVLLVAGVLILIAGGVGAYLLMAPSSAPDNSPSPGETAPPSSSPPPARVAPEQVLPEPAGDRSTEELEAERDRLRAERDRLQQELEEKRADDDVPK